MFLLDANLLLYAYYPRAEQHEASRAWIEETFNGPEQVGLPWPTIWAFLRIGTNPRAFEQPLSVAEACEVVSSWLELPAVALVEPGDRHWQVLSELMPRAQVSGPMVSDAVLAALAIEHGATLCTTDRDFARFQGLKFINPLLA